MVIRREVKKMTIKDLVHEFEATINNLQTLNRPTSRYDYINALDYAIERIQDEILNQEPCWACHILTISNQAHLFVAKHALEEAKKKVAVRMYTTGIIVKYCPNCGREVCRLDD